MLVLTSAVQHKQRPDGCISYTTCIDRPRGVQPASKANPPKNRARSLTTSTRNPDGVPRSGLLTQKISLNIYWLLGISIRVRHFRSILFALVAFLWLPVSAHCQLETVPGLEFLACQSAGPASGNPNSHCADSGCCSAERSEYTAEQTPFSQPSPDLFVITSEPVLTLPNSLPAEVSVGILTAAPPELSTTWHFASRTALPVRAPSTAS